MRRPVAQRQLQDHVLHLLRWSVGFRVPARASKGTKRRSRAGRRQMFSRRRPPLVQDWFRDSMGAGVRPPQPRLEVPPPTVLLLMLLLAARVTAQQLLPGRCPQEARKVDRKVDRRLGHLEAPMGDPWAVPVEVLKGDQPGVPLEARPGGHWAAPWRVRVRKWGFLTAPQRAKVVRCHQTLRQACRRAGLVRLHHGNVLLKILVSPCIHPYRPHGAA